MKDDLGFGAGDDVEHVFDAAVMGVDVVCAEEFLESRRIGGWADDGVGVEAFALEAGGEVAADEASGPGDQRRRMGWWGACRGSRGKGGIEASEGREGGVAWGEQGVGVRPGDAGGVPSDAGVVGGGVLGGDVVEDGRGVGEGVEAVGHAGGIYRRFGFFGREFEEKMLAEGGEFLRRSSTASRILPAVQVMKRWRDAAGGVWKWRPRRTPLCEWSGIVREVGGETPASEGVAVEGFDEGAARVGVRGGENFEAAGERGFDALHGQRLLGKPRISPAV